MTSRSTLFASLVFAVTLLSSPAFAERSTDYKLTGTSEIGFLGVIDHNVQFDKTGSDFDYDTQGGQDVLFAVSRFSLDLSIKDRHTLTFLYQPLELVTRRTLTSDLDIDGVTFPSGTPMQFTYGFPFYRASYTYDLIAHRRHELSVGGSLQIRNATIEFEDLAGTQLVSNRGIGPVPLLRLRGKYAFENGLWLGTEIDGAYAPVSYINGSDNEVVGALLDASGRVGLQLGQRVDAFFNVRYLGGGAVGSSSRSDGQGDGYVRNWLHFYTATIGFQLHIIDL